MATNIRIEINGQQVDTDAGRLPVVLTRRIDKWADFVGSDGTAAKALSDTLYLPATKRNNLLLADFGDFDKDSTAAQGLLTVELFVNGISTFWGYGQRVSASKTYTLNTVFAIKVLGDAVDVYERIDSLTLPDLPMGNFINTPANINATWSGLADDSRPLVFAPMFYGGASGSIVTVFNSNATYAIGLRPSVRVRAILIALFEVQLGYAIQSAFFDSEAGRNLVYPYSVGHDWQRDDDITPYTCLVGANPQSWIGAQASVGFTIESPTGGIAYNDAQGLNNGVGRYFEPPTNGWYKFEFRIDGSNIDRIILQGQIGNTAQTINYGEYQPNVVNVTEEPILFEPNVIVTGAGATRLRFIVVRAQDPPITIGISAAYYRATLTNRFAYGLNEPLRIATCLHDAGQKEFLRGLQHALGLVIGIDNVARRVYIDPRFANATQTGAFPYPSAGANDSYYQNDSTAEALQADVRDTQLSNLRPFGDSLTLAYGIDTGDALYSYVNEQRGYDAPNAVPLLGSRISFIAADKKPTVSRNPFFTNLLNVGFNVNPARYQQFPCIIEELDELFGEPNGRMPSFRGEPKLATYYGVLDFLGAGYFDTYELAYIDFVANLNTLIYAFPCVFQMFPEDEGYFQTLGGVPFSATYAKIDYNAIGSQPTVLGLVDRYHSKYLSIIYSDRWLSCTLRLPLSKYRDDLFRMPKILAIGGEKIRVWQTETNAFEPQTSETAQATFIADYDNIKDKTYAEENNGDVPVVITGFPFELIAKRTPIVPAFDADAQAYITAVLLAGGTLDANEQAATNALFVGLKADNLYSEYFAIYLMIGGTAAAHKLNAVNPLDTDAAFRLVFFGGWTHSATGALPNAVNAYANTFFEPLTHATAADNMGLSYWSRTTSVGSYLEMGSNGVGANPNLGQTFIAPAFGASNTRAVNTNGNSSGAALNSKGYFQASRQDAVNYRFYANGALVANNAAGANQLSQRAIAIGALNNNGAPALFTDRECILATINNGLSDAQHTQAYNRFLAFQIAFGNRQL